MYVEELDPWGVCAQFCICGLFNSVDNRVKAFNSEHNTEHIVQAAIKYLISPEQERLSWEKPLSLAVAAASWTPPHPGSSTGTQGAADLSLSILPHL